MASVNSADGIEILDPTVRNAERVTPAPRLTALPGLRLVHIVQCARCHRAGDPGYTRGGVQHRRLREGRADAGGGARHARIPDPLRSPELYHPDAPAST